MAALSEQTRVRENCAATPLPLPAAPDEHPRVAVVLTQLGLGGAELQTIELLKRLKGSTWEPVVVICLSEDLEPYGRVVEDLGYRLEVMDRRGSFDLPRLLSLRNLLGAYRITLVHAVHLLAAGYSWIACSLGRKVSVLPTFRSSNIDHGLLRRFVYKRMLAGSPFTLVNSHCGARILVDGLGASRERVVVVPNGVDFPELRESAATPELRSELGIATTDPVVGFVGRNRRVKNVPRFLEIAGRLFEQIPGLHIVVVGSGLDESVRGRLAPNLPSARTHFLGPRQNVPALLKDMDVLVITSDSEGCPNVALEALGLGVPVVSADVGDVGRMIAAAQRGAVVRPDDVDGYVEQVLRQLPDHRRDRVTSSSLDCLNLERDYSLDSMVLGTVGLWRRLLIERRHRLDQDGLPD